MSGTLRLRGSTSGYSELQAPAVAADQTFILPTAGGTLLTTDSPISKLTLELGSASQPSLTFEGDTDTGLYSSGTNTLNLVTGGSNRLNIDSGGKIGIGTTSGNRKVVAEQANSTAYSSSDFDQDYHLLKLRNSTDSGSAGLQFSIGVNGEAAITATEVSDGETDLCFGTRGSGSRAERMRILSSGNVGIGITNAAAKTHISKSYSAPTGGHDGNLGLIVSNSSTNNSYSGIGISAGNNAGSFIHFGDTDDDNVGAFNYFHDSNSFTFVTNAQERMRIDSSGNVAIGKSSPNTRFEIFEDTLPYIYLQNSTTGTTATDGLSIVEFGLDAYINNREAGNMLFFNNGSERMRIDSSGNVGIGTTSPRRHFHVHNPATATTGLMLTNANTGEANDSQGFQLKVGADSHAEISQMENSHIGIFTNATERMRIDSSGKVGIGTSSPTRTLTVQGDMNLASGSKIESDSSGGTLQIQGGSTYSGGNILLGGGTGTNDIRFRTTGNSTTQTERMRIDSSGNVLFGTTSNGTTAKGIVLRETGELLASRVSGPPLLVNRLTDDGTLVDFRGQNTSEGSISISGSTVSYNGGHLSRWSQLSNGAERIEILRGSVLSNLDEMCEWGEEDNEQLNRMKVSDVEGDKNVSGVFQCWDDDDDVYLNDFYCAMTGDFVIRIAEGTTVACGDLLMSAGDGTAKPQDDDIIRSKTIAKVTSTNVSETYADGSYCVPCVLMAC
jgi:hypothetical protein